MISIKNPDQIAKMRTAGALLYEVLQKLREAVKPGMTTAALDVYAEQLIRKNHAIPSFLHYNGYPATLCTSIDDQIVHGIPSESQVLKEGSILSIDCGLVLDGWQADSAFTMGIGEISAEAEALIEVTEECFWKGVRQAVAGNRLGDLGHAVQSWAEGHGYGVIRDLCGHGIQLRPTGVRNHDTAQGHPYARCDGLGPPCVLDTPREGRCIEAKS